MVSILIAVLVNLAVSGGTAQETEYESLVKLGRLTQVFEDNDYTTVEFIQEDILIPGNFFIGDRGALGYLRNGQMIHLVGNPIETAYYEGSGSYAYFHLVTGISQYNSTDIAVVDSKSHCVRNIKRDGWSTSPMVGRCEAALCDQKLMNGSKDYDATEPLGCTPRTPLFDDKTNLLFINNLRGANIMQYSFDTNLVKLKLLYDYANELTNILFNTDHSQIFVVAEHQVIFTLDLNSNAIQNITGHYYYDDEENLYDQPSGVDISDALYDIEAMEWIIPDQLLIVSTRKPGGFKLVDLIQGKAQTYCVEDDYSYDYEFMLGTISECQLYNPSAITVSNNTIYIADYHPPKSDSSTDDENWVIISLPIIAVPQCAPPEVQPGITFFPQQEVYGSEETIKFQCDKNMSLHSNYNTIKCTGGYLSAIWNPQPPKCVLANLSVLKPQYGRKAGGTMVTAKGNFPPNSTIFLDFNTTKELIMVQTRNRSTIEATFQMPAHTWGLSQVTFQTGEIIQHLNFTFTENPEVISFSRNRTIKSGGLDIIITGIHLQKATEYILALKEESANVPTGSNVTCRLSAKNIEVICTPENLYDWLIPQDSTKERFIQATLIGDGLVTIGSSQIILTIYDDPVFNNIESHYKEGEIIGFGDKVVLTGSFLSKGVDKDDYKVNLGDSVNCAITELTEISLICLPDEIALHKKLQENIGYLLIPIEVQVGSKIYKPGHFRYNQSITSTGKDDSPLDQGVVVPGVITAGCLSIIICVIIIFALYRRSMNQRRQKKQPAEPTDPIIFEDLGEDLRAKLEAIAISPRDLIFSEHSEPLGQGCFGCVYFGQLVVNSGTILKSVAVKTMKNTQDIDAKMISDFLTEATLLIGRDHHANILHTVGVVWSLRERPKVVLPYMAKGDLKSLLTNDSYKFTNGDLLHFAMQISNGMEYLSLNKIVHRDLAARNCLVSEEFLVKVADFGLSRGLYAKDYYKDSDRSRPRPVKWMALESLTNGRYTTETDVWSFGITMWEICTRGSIPYPMQDNSEVLVYLQQGGRLNKPHFSHDDVFHLMKRCWLMDPEDRPTFLEIKIFLSGLVLNVVDRTTDNSSYEREYTKEIPSDYADGKSLKGGYNADYSSDYLQILPDQAAPVESVYAPGDAIHGLESLVRENSVSEAAGASRPLNYYQLERLPSTGSLTNAELQLYKNVPENTDNVCNERLTNLADDIV